MGSNQNKESGFKYDNNIQKDFEEYINKRTENNFYKNFNSNHNFIEINNANDTYIRDRSKKEKISKESFNYWEYSFDYCLEKIVNNNNQLLKIKKSRKLESKYENQKNILVSVLGKKYSGKTFLLNNINNKIDYDEKSLFKEKNFYIRYAKSPESNVCYIECPAFDNYFEETKIEENLEININFYINFCLKYSQMIILVVNEMTTEDLLMINLIKSKCIQSQKIIIIHNLKFYFTKEEIDYYISNYFSNNNKNEKNDEILKIVTFTGADSDQNKLYFNENYINPSDNNKEIDIIHAVLGNEDLFFYNSTIDLIKVNIQSLSHQSQIFNLEKNLINFSEEFFQKKSFKINDEKILYYEKSNKSEEKKFQPLYSYYIDKAKDIFVINIESIYKPDNLKISCSKKQEFQIFKISYTYDIKENNDKELYKIKDNKIFSDIQYGDYELTLLIPLDKVYFDSSKKNILFKNGIIIIEYPIIKDEGNSDPSDVELKEEEEEESDEKKRIDSDSDGKEREDENDNSENDENENNNNENDDDDENDDNNSKKSEKDDDSDDKERI